MVNGSITDSAITIWFSGKTDMFEEDFIKVCFYSEKSDVKNYVNIQNYHAVSYK